NTARRCASGRMTPQPDKSRGDVMVRLGQRRPHYLPHGRRPLRAFDHASLASLGSADAERRPGQLDALVRPSRPFKTTPYTEAVTISPFPPLLFASSPPCI